MITSFLERPEPLLRERAVNALDRIGRADYSLIEPYWKELFRFADDEEPKVRLSFIWASENIATNTPENSFQRRLMRWREPYFYCLVFLAMSAVSCYS